MNGLILGTVLCAEKAPHGQTFPRRALVQEYAATSRTVGPKCTDTSCASGELARVRQTVRALERRDEFANYRDF